MMGLGAKHEPHCWTHMQLGVLRCHPRPGVGGLSLHGFCGEGQGVSWASFPPWRHGASSSGSVKPYPAIDLNHFIEDLCKIKSL